MNRKNILAVIGAVVLLAAAFFISYGISYKSNLAADKAPSSAQTTASAQATAPAAEPSGSQDGETAAENEATTAVNSLQALPSPQTVEVPEEGWELTLINRYYKLSEYYEPRLDTAIEGSEVYLDSRVAEQFRQMYAAAQADGIDLTPFSGYVSFERQSRRFEDKTAEFMDEGYEKALAEVLASEYVMPAGCSEDNAGFSVWPCPPRCRPRPAARGRRARRSPRRACRWR